MGRSDCATLTPFHISSSYATNTQSFGPSGPNNELCVCEWLICLQIFEQIEKRKSLVRSDDILTMRRCSNARTNAESVMGCACRWCFLLRTWISHVCEKRESNWYFVFFFRGQLNGQHTYCTRTCHSSYFHLSNAPPHLRGRSTVSNGPIISNDSLSASVWICFSIRSEVRIISTTPSNYFVFAVEVWCVPICVHRCLPVREERKFD